MAEEGRPVLDRGKVASALVLGTDGLSGLKRPGREADNSSSCSVDVTDAWRCSCALLDILVAWCSNELGGKFSFHRYFAFFFALQIIIIVFIAAVGTKSERMRLASQTKMLGAGQYN